MYLRLYSQRPSFKRPRNNKRNQETIIEKKSGIPHRSAAIQLRCTLTLVQTLLSDFFAGEDDCAGLCNTKNCSTLDSKLIVSKYLRSSSPPKLVALHCYHGSRWRKSPWNSFYSLIFARCRRWAALTRSNRRLTPTDKPAGGRAELSLLLQSWSNPGVHNAKYYCILRLFHFFW